MKLDSFAWILKLEFLAGYRPYIAAVGLIGLAVYHFSTGQFDFGLAHFLAALAALGIRDHKPTDPPIDEPDDDIPF